MEIYTIGFAKKTAPQFFGALEKVGIQRLIDVRLNNTSQLAGFTKRDDLAFFLSRILAAGYLHDLLLAPTPELLSRYKKGHGSWKDYEHGFRLLMSERKIELSLDPNLFSSPTVLLCSEAQPSRCHRRLVVDYLAAKWGNVRAVHL